MLNLKEIVKTREKMLSNYEIEMKTKLLEKEKEKTKLEELFFKNEYEVFRYINFLSEKNNLSIEIIGREFEEKIQQENIKGFFYQAYGTERDIYKFIEELEQEKRYISLKKENILIETKGNNIELKANIMYMSNNTGNSNKLINESEEVLKDFKPRNIWKTRRTF